MIVSVSEYDIESYRDPRILYYDDRIRFHKKKEAYENESWIDNAGRIFIISKMKDKHLFNAIKYIEEHLKRDDFRPQYKCLMKMYYVKLCGERQRRLDKMIKI